MNILLKEINLQGYDTKRAKRIGWLSEERNKAS